MKKIFAPSILAVCLTLIATPFGASAQSSQGLAKAEAVAQKLNLTPQQKAKVLPILKEEAPKLEQIKSNSSLTGLQKMKELRAIHNETTPQLQQILSPDQYQKLQAMREQEIREAIARKRAGG